MKTKDIITEWSTQDAAVEKRLKQLGYQKLGAGVDCTAWLEPSTGQVLKIFGTNKVADRTSGMSHDQLMFKQWSAFCEANKNNPFLPRFSGWTSFVMHGKTYLQIRMEKLAKLPDSLGSLLEDMADSVPYRSTDDVMQQFTKNLGVPTSYGSRQDDGSYGRVHSHRDDAIAELAIMLGEEDFRLLISTIKQLNRLGKQYGYINDLHDGNFMHRNDGIPVIVDPWVVSTSGPRMPQSNSGSW